MPSLGISNFASAQVYEAIPVNPGVPFVDNYIIEQIEDSESYQMIKFTNIETGAVEYLESTITEEKSEYRSIFDNEEILITREGDMLTTYDVKNKVTKTTDLSINSDEIRPFDLDMPGNGNHNWVLYNTYYGSRALDWATLSYVAGMVAGVFGGSATMGLVVTTASYLISLNAKHFWYIQELWLWRNSFHYPASYNKYYAYPDYTNLINTIYYQNW